MLDYVSTVSAGLLLYRRARPTLEVPLGHMGGPFFALKDDHGWTIPKGAVEPGESALAAAHREFAEEVGIAAPDVAWRSLGTLAVSGRKTVEIWAGESDLDLGKFVSNTFELEWPRGSGRLQRYPELDRAGWFNLATAATKLAVSQTAFLDRLVESLGSVSSP